MAYRVTFTQGPADVIDANKLERIGDTGGFAFGFGPQAGAVYHFYRTAGPPPPAASGAAAMVAALSASPPTLVAVHLASRIQAIELLEHGPKEELDRLGRWLVEQGLAADLAAALVDVTMALLAPVVAAQTAAVFDAASPPA